MPAVDGGFTVTYTMTKFLPVTVPVQVINHPRRFLDAGIDHDRSQPGDCGTEARRAAAQAGSQAAAQAETADAGSAARGIAVPAPASRPLIPDRVRCT